MKVTIQALLPRGVERLPAQLTAVTLHLLEQALRLLLHDRHEGSSTIAILFPGRFSITGPRPYFSDTFCIRFTARASRPRRSTPATTLGRRRMGPLAIVGSCTSPTT